MASSSVVCVSILTDQKKVIIQNKICSGFESFLTFRVFFNIILEKFDLKEEVSKFIELKVDIKDKKNNKFQIDVDETLENARVVTDGIYINYVVKLEPPPEPECVVENNENEPVQDAFEILMLPKLKDLNPVTVSNKKDELHNKILEDLQAQGSILNSHFDHRDGTKALKLLTDTVWYLDGRQQTIAEAVKSRGKNVITPIPERFTKYQKYQDWAAWKKKPKFEKQKCVDLSDALVRVTEKQALNIPEDWRHDILTLSSSLSTYATYLSNACENQQKRQLELTPIRQLGTHAKCQYFAPVSIDHVNKNLHKLSEIVAEADVFEPILLDNTDHFPKGISSYTISTLMKTLALTSPVMLIRYDPGGGSKLLSFVFRFPLNFNVDERYSKALQLFKQTEPEIPIYHTRAMRKSFNAKVQSLNSFNLQPHYLCHIYRLLTGDASAEITSSEIDYRIKYSLETEDPDLISDLRHLNKGRPGDTFRLFFEELNKVVEEKTAVNDRRHGVAYMSEFLSVRDLIQQVSKSLPSGTPIPSESTVILAFALKNMHVRTSQYYTSKVNLKHSIQRRQLRAFHSDGHWCNALLRYLREMAIKFRDEAVFISADDKAKVAVGEPGYAISSGVRGKTSIAPTTTTLASLDHDVNQKASITPSVALVCKIPEDIRDSFYRGQVFVTLKDSVFEPSTSFRSVLEMYKSILRQPMDSNRNMKYVFIITDGGPEHRCNFESVKLPLILLYKHLNLDFLVAIITAPGGSYINIVERIMSILNIGFQNVALERSESCFETEIRKLRNLEELRKKESIIKTAWLESLEEVKDTLSNRIKRLALKEYPFQVLEAVSENELTEFVDEAGQIDEGLPEMIQTKKLTANDLAKIKKYQDFKKKHCKEGQYAFQIMRRCEVECCVGGALSNELDWLPYPMPDDNNPGHFKTFNQVYGDETSEEFLPSKMNNIRKVTEEQQGCKSNVLVAQNVREIVTCSDCSKPRCIYALKKLTDRQMRELKGVMRKYDYMCGCMITPDISQMFGVVFTRLELTCQSPLEWAYFGSSLKSIKRDLCVYCIAPNSEIDKELKKCYKTVLPICKSCSENGKVAMKRGPLHTASAQRSIKAMMPPSKKKK